LGTPPASVKGSAAPPRRSRSKPPRAETPELPLERLAGHRALTKDRAQRADPQLGVIGDRHRAGARLAAELHHDVASAAADVAEAVGFEDAADFAAGEDAEPSHARGRAG